MLVRVLRAVRTPLTLLVLLGVLGYGAYWGWTHVAAPPAEPTPIACVDQKVTKNQLKSSQVTVNVYNGGKVRGLAGTVAQDLRGRGFKTSVVGNTKADEVITTTIVVGAAAKNPEVKLVLSFFKGAKVREDQRTDRSVDVLVGNKYGGFNTKAATAIAVTTQTVCLPPTPTPTSLG